MGVWKTMSRDFEAVVVTGMAKEKFWKTCRELWGVLKLQKTGISAELVTQKRFHCS
jgi:hypothetical protein